MTTNKEMERIVRSWLEPGLTTLTDDVLDPVLDQLPATPQRRPVWPPRRFRYVGSFAKFSLAAAALVVVAIVGINLASRSGQPIVGGDPTPSSSVGAVSPSPVASQSAPTAQPSDAGSGSLPELGLPGARGGPAGEYGWEGGAGSRAWMHKVSGGREAMSLTFTVRADCLPASGNQQSHAIPVGDRTLCALLTWDQTTTEDELEAAAQILESIRAEPIGEDRIRIVFTLDGGWDTG